MKKSSLSVILVLLLLMMLISSCVSSGDNSMVVSETSDAVSSQTSQISDEVSVPEVNMNGQEIRFLVPGSQYIYYESFDIYAEELNNEIVNDAVFNRNKKISQKITATVFWMKKTLMDYM